ncbi:kelch-like protein 4 isoform X4 [Onthophagus taurus]|uniref:kelch-like protein 4 isoform X4 n=1 Tax=Onthophagus taurus TaxID=166361 RepID=UPI0039BE8387
METQKIYKKQEVIVEIFQRLSAMRDSKLCDITLVVDDVKIHAHKVVLAACSEFMKTLLTGDFKEYQQPTIKLSEINAEAANQVVNYMYGSSIKITIDNVFNILRISRMWFINTLLEECEQFLMKSLNISNALLIWTNFRLLDQNQIKTRAEDLLGCHFTTRNRNGYSAVPEKVDLITGTITSITSMNIARRDVALCGLDNFIYAIGGTDGNQALKYAERYNIHTNVWERLSDMNYPRKRAVAASVKGLLYVFGDLNNVGGAFNTISVYDPENKLWTDIPSEISFCCTEPLSITSDENMIYVFGKDNALGSGTNRVAVFNPETKTWNKDLIKSSISLTKTIYGAAFMKNFKSS